MKRATPWVMLLALCSGFLLSNAYRTVATLVAPALQAELALSPQQLGLFAGIFHFAFGSLQMVMGIGIDLYGVRRTILWAFPWAIAGAVLTAVAPSYAWLLVAQAMIGIGCAPAFLVCTVLIAKHFAPEKFAAVSGIALGLGGMGMLLTGTPLAWVIELSSWRMGFAVLAALSALAWVVMWWWVQEEAPPAGKRGWPALQNAWVEFVTLCRLPQTLGIVVLGAVTYAAYITLRGLWLGPLMIERFGMSLVQAGHVALLMSVVALVGPAFFGRFDPKVPKRRTWIVRMTWFMALMFLVLAYSHIWWLTVGLAVLMSFLGGYMVLQYADVRQSYTSEQTGRAMAVFTMAMFLGIALMQWCTGVVAAWASTWGADTYTAVLLAVGGVFVLGQHRFPGFTSSTTAHLRLKMWDMKTHLSRPSPGPLLSILDLVSIREGGTVAQAIDITVRTAQHAEALGFQRYWLAEHHNMNSVASSATAVLVGHVAGATSTIRVGSGGIMLPNHAPLVVAEAFGTLAELYPGRIDLGLGRAPGTDGYTMQALRRDRHESEEDFPRDVAELQELLDDPQPGQRIIAMPGAGTKVPIWLLGSSLFSARLAAQRGLPFAFASHFAPRYLLAAIEVYRREFKPSATLQAPYVAVGVPLIAAPTDAEAELLASSSYQRVLGIVTGKRGRLARPVPHFMEKLHPQEREAVQSFLAAAVVGGPSTVLEGLAHIYDLTKADELVLVSDVFEVDLRLRSLTIAANALRDLHAQLAQQSDEQTLRAEALAHSLN